MRCKSLSDVCVGGGGGGVGVSVQIIEYYILHVYEEYYEEYWNKGVRRILILPHDAHTWLFGPLLKQNHIKKQFIVRTLRFLFCML